MLAEIRRVLRPGGGLFLEVDTFSITGLLKWHFWTKRRHSNEILVRAHPYRFREGDVCSLLKMHSFECTLNAGHSRLEWGSRQKSTITVLGPASIAPVGPNRAQRVTRYSPREYWTQLARDFAQDDATGFAPVLHPGTPYWFNEAIDGLQSRAWGRVLDHCELGKGALLLDVGCGTGRWLRRCGQRGLSGVGVDQSLAMLRLARQRATLSPLFAGEIQSLPFLDESFDCVSGVTVVQHIPSTQQEQALREIVRVLRPDGYLILFELIRGHGPHVFSRTPAGWISRGFYARTATCSLVRARIPSSRQVVGGSATTPSRSCLGRCFSTFTGQISRRG